MKRDVYWEPYEAFGLEHLQFTTVPLGYAADGLILKLDTDTSYRVRYKIKLDTQWRVLETEVRSLGDSEKMIFLKSDGAGNWTGAAGEILKDLAGCYDVDITLTPFTNTLPIRRLDLAEGQAQAIDVAYIDAQQMTVSLSKQRYTCLKKEDPASLYRYEGLDTGFTANLIVDSDGFVTEYEGLFRIK